MASTEQAAEEPKTKEAEFKPVGSEEVIVVDDADLALFLRPAGVTKLRTWYTELKEAQDRPRLLGFRTPEITTRFCISVDDLLKFDGSYERGIQSPCVASVFPDDRQSEVTKGDVVITGCAARVSHIDEAFSLLNEAVSIGSSMSREFLHNQAQLDPEKKAHKAFSKLEAERGTDQMLGVTGRSTATVPFMFVPPLSEQYLVTHDSWALLTTEAVCVRSATLTRKDSKPSYVILPENHGLVMVLKNSTQAFVKQITLVSAADVTKGEPQYVIISHELYRTLAAEAVNRSKFGCPSTTLDRHTVFAIYKYKDEAWKDPEERARLEALGDEARKQRHSLEIKYSIEHYNLTPASAPWRAKKGLEGVWVPGVPVIDAVSAIKAADLSQLQIIPNSKLTEFYKSESAERAKAKKLAEAFTRVYLRTAIYGSDETQ